jgi:hypothetical protein
MSDDLTQRGGSDRQRINVNQDYELRDWARRLGVSQQELKEAVRAVGDRADKVRDHLASRGGRGGPSAR